MEYPSVPGGNIRYFIGDVRDIDRLKKAFAGVNYIIHAAAMKQLTGAPAAAPAGTTAGTTSMRWRKQFGGKRNKKSRKERKSRKQRKSRKSRK